MDEILRTPNHVPVRPASRSARRSGREQKNTDWSDRLHRFADAAAARSRRLKLQSARVYHRVHSATAGKPKLGPLSFLALSLVIGLASVVGVVYTPAYVVSVDGVDLGLVKEPQVFEACGEQRYHVAMMDYGVKQNMIECLRRRGCKVTVFPANTPAETILTGGFDGVMLSNGPGDPAENVAIIAELKKLYESTIPMFGVCLGHQLLALATGAKTGRLAYGHRGGNHPVRDIAEGRVFITSQNHGYMVLSDSVDPSVAEVSHVNVNDGTCEGLRYKRPNCFTTQFHPEANAGPRDTEYLFDRFVASMGGDK